MGSNEYPSDYENEETEDNNSDLDEKDTSENTKPFTKTEYKEDVKFTEYKEDGKTVKNKTFSSFEIREIKNNNAGLMKKVVAQSYRKRQYKTVTYNGPKISSAEVNRRKKQRKIDHDNLLLLKKIQAIKPFGLSKN